MAKANNFIELNGKRYDARTGTMLADSPISPSRVHSAGQDVIRSRRSDGVTNLAPPKPTLQPVSNKKVMDGFVRTPSGNHAKALHAKAAKSTTLKRTSAPQVKASQPATIASTSSTTIRPAPQTVKPHQPVQAQTLMRSAVKKPNITRKPGLKVQAPAASAIKKLPFSQLATKQSSSRVDTHRLARAEQIPRHEQIKRFARPNIPLQAQLPTRPIATPIIAVKPAPLSALSTVTSTSAKHDIFAHALASATSHEETYTPERSEKSRRRAGRLLTASAVALSFLILVGFIGYQNKTNLQVRMASSQAGFQANLPDYKPVGFAYKGLTAEPGEVSLAYNSVTTQDKYTMVQKASTWNSATLLDNFILNNNRPYETQQVNGQTIYLYENNATWVSGGVWYQIQADGSSLSERQLLDIAASV